MVVMCKHNPRLPRPTIKLHQATYWLKKKSRNRIWNWTYRHSGPDIMADITLL